MVGRLNHHQVTVILLAVGGHTVLEKLLHHETRDAIYQSLGVAACVLIFFVLHQIVERSNNNSD